MTGFSWSFCLLIWVGFLGTQNRTHDLALCQADAYAAEIYPWPLLVRKFLKIDNLDNFT